MLLVLGPYVRKTCKKAPSDLFTCFLRYARLLYMKHAPHTYGSKTRIQNLSTLFLLGHGDERPTHLWSESQWCRKVKKTLKQVGM